MHLLHGRPFATAATAKPIAARGLHSRLVGLTPPWSSPSKRGGIRSNTSTGAEPLTAAEEEANKRRWEESGGSQGSVDSWRWRLEWNEIPGHNIVIGACPRSPDDMAHIAAESGATAVMSLQSDVCLEALVIAYGPIRRRALELGVLPVRIPVLDFSLSDQTAMLPEAVRMLSTLLAMGKKVYVHCTAGINRATLTTVGYLTFVLGMELHDAVALVKSARPQAHPYIDCWTATRQRLLASREEEVQGLARSMFMRRQESGEHESPEADGVRDWLMAENLLIQETFRRQLAHNLSLIAALQDMHATQLGPGVAAGDVDALVGRVATLQQRADQASAALRARTDELEVAREQLAALRTCDADAGDSECGAQAFEDSQVELASMRGALRAVAASARQLVEDEGDDEPSP